MQTKIDVETLKTFVTASENALTFITAAANVSAGDVFNSLHNAKEDAQYLIAKAERRKYEPRYRDEGDTDAELSPLMRRLRDDKLTKADYKFIQDKVGISL